MRRNPLKLALAAGRPAVGTWLTLGSVPAARHLARAGFDWLCVDREHSPVDLGTASLMMGAIADAGGVPLARVASNRPDEIARTLDAGAFGVVVPAVTNREQAERAVAACRYPPRGSRGVGGGSHHLNFAATPADYALCANDEVAVILQCEHIDAVRNFASVYGGLGVDAVFVGPNDLAASLRRPDGSAAPAAELEEALQAVLAGCRSLGVAAGLHTFTAADARRRLAEGWQLVAVASELQLMLSAAGATLGELRGQ